MKNNKIIIGLSFYLFLPLGICAQSLIPDAQFSERSNKDFSASLSFGNLSGMAKEYVYWTLPSLGNAKLSELDWRTDLAPTLGVALEYQIFPWLSLHGKGWTLLSEGIGKLEDFDWKKQAQAKFTDLSSSYNTPTTKANALDFNLRAWLLSSSYYQLGVIGGYQSNYFKYKSIGGFAWYNEGEFYGNFPDIPIVSYQQQFKVPYLGLAGKLNYQKFEMNAMYKWSPLASGKDQDTHHLRDLTFSERLPRTSFHALSVDTGYYFTPHSKIFLEAAFEHYLNARADMTVFLPAGEILEVPQRAGMGNKNFILSLGLCYRL